MEKYSIDTSVLIDLQRHYQNEQKLINLFKENFRTHNFLISKYVLDELVKDGHEFFINFKDKPYSTCVIDLNENVQIAIQEINEKVPGYINVHSSKNKADPYVIATAIALKTRVLTQEKFNQNDNEEYRKKNPDKLKIPNICNTLNIICKDLVQFLSDMI